MYYTKEEMGIDTGNSFDTIVHLAKDPCKRIASFSTGISKFTGATPDEAKGNLNLFLAGGDMYEALRAMLDAYEKLRSEKPLLYNMLNERDRVCYKRFQDACIKTEKALNKAEHK